MSKKDATGRRVQIYLSADLLDRWERTPRYERSAEVAKALRAWWNIGTNVATSVASEPPTDDLPRPNAE